jgi:hypothetical protein
MSERHTASKNNKGNFFAKIYLLYRNVEHGIIAGQVAE